MITYELQILRDGRDHRTGKGELGFVTVEWYDGSTVVPLDSFTTEAEADAEMTRRRRVTGRVYRVVSSDGTFKTRPDPKGHLPARELYKRWLAGGSPE